MKKRLNELKDPEKQIDEIKIIIFEKIKDNSLEEIKILISEIEQINILKELVKYITDLNLKSLLELKIKSIILERLLEKLSIVSFDLFTQKEKVKFLIEKWLNNHC